MRYRVLWFRAVSAALVLSGAACTPGTPPERGERVHSAEERGPAVPDSSAPADTAGRSGRGPALRISNWLVVPDTAFRTVGPEGLAFRAGVAPVDGSPGEFVVSVAVTNVGRDTVRVKFGPCPNSVRAYRTAARTGRPAWDEWRWKRDEALEQERTTFFVCSGVEWQPLLAPGESLKRPLRTYVRAAQILGDSLPPGRYFFSEVLGLQDLVFEVPAGDAVLAR